MLKHPFTPTQEDDISLSDSINFLLKSWRTIALMGLLGFIFAIAYLLVIPKKYQAIAQIQMAQIAVNTGSNQLGINVEDPNLLLFRLKLPTTYSSKEIKACGLKDAPFPSEVLVSNIRFSNVKNLNSIIEIKVDSYSHEVAMSCAQALFEAIKSSQHEIAQSFIEEYKALLVKYDDKFRNEKLYMGPRTGESETFFSAEFLSSRDAVKLVIEEIFRINVLIKSAEMRQAKLVSPIYASNKPIFPKNKESLIVGLISGLFLGLLIVIGKKALKTH